MKKHFVFILSSAVLLCLTASAASSAPADSRLQRVKTWAFAIGDGMLDGNVAARFAAYDLVIVDGEDVQAAEVAALRKNGTIVLAYLSVGTIEKWRWWYSRVKNYRLEYWGDWGEWYADTSRDGYRNVIVREVAPWILKKGVDGLFLDNTDMIETHPGQKAGMRVLVRRLSTLVRSSGKFLFTQNGEDSLGPTLIYYDGWNREDVSWTYDFDTGRYQKQPTQEINRALNALRRIGAAGLLVTATDYTKAGDRAAELLCVRNACAAGALPFVSNIHLSRLPAAPLQCPYPPAS